MKFIILSIFASLASAVSFTNSAGDFADIEVGKPFEISWTDAQGPVTVTLKSGPSDNLVDVSTITCEFPLRCLDRWLPPIQDPSANGSTAGETGDSFTWTPPSDLSEGTRYAFEITDGGEVNYSEQFLVAGGGAAPSSTGSATATGTESSAYSTTAPSTTSTGSITSTATTASVTATSSGNSTASATLTTSSTNSTLTRTSSAETSSAGRSTTLSSSPHPNLSSKSSC